MLQCKTGKQVSSSHFFLSPCVAFYSQNACGMIIAHCINHTEPSGTLSQCLRYDLRTLRQSHPVATELAKTSLRHTDWTWFIANCAKPMLCIAFRMQYRWLSTKFSLSDSPALPFCIIISTDVGFAQFSGDALIRFGKESMSWSTARPPAPSLADVRRSKSMARRCLNKRWSSGFSRGDWLVAQSVTKDKAADSWKTSKWACASGSDETNVTTEAGCALSLIQPAGPDLLAQHHQRSKL